MRHPATVVLAAATLLLAVATGCAQDTGPEIPTAKDATATCLDYLTQATGHQAVVEAHTTTSAGPRAWTVTGRAGDRTFTCDFAYRLEGGGLATTVHYETDPPLDEDPPADQPT